MKKGIVQIATSCSKEDCCPIAELDRKAKIVKIYDPEKPERGEFEMPYQKWLDVVAIAPSLDPVTCPIILLFNKEKPELGSFEVTHDEMIRLASSFKENQ